MKILKDSLIYLIGELFAKILPFLLMPYLTRKLGSEGFGELSYYQTISALLLIFMGLSQDGALTRYFYVYGSRNLKTLLYAGYGYTFLVSFLALIYAWWVQSFILLSVILATTAQTLLSTQLAWRQCQKQAIPYITLQIASGVLVSILTVVLIEFFKQSSISRFAALFLGQTIIVVIAWIILSKIQYRFRLRIQAFQKSLCYIFAFGLPLIFHHLSAWAKGQLDRIMIYEMYSKQELGIYSAGFQLATILSILLLALNKAIVPYYYQSLKSQQLNPYQIRKYALISLLIVPIPAVLSSILPESLFLWFLGSEYIGIQYYLTVFLLGFGLSIPYYILVNYLFYLGKNKTITWISTASTLIYLGILWITSQLHIHAIPWAMIIGNFSILPILYYYTKPYPSLS